MKSVIVGTSGHIDHGKTALVRALTGVDTDRLKEEKRRGITIELGFAHLALPTPAGPVRLAFVDVPGHERFVHNMLAGVGGIDLVLLVISAEESIKPQTREHFDICRLLQVPRGITVLTKCDLAGAEARQLARLEAEELVRGSFLDAARSPVIEVSARTGEGLDELRRELARLATGAAARDTSAPFRLPIDRVFTMKGFGTVVTGTTVSGALAADGEVELLPPARTLRVRGVQVHGAAAAQAVAGERTAVNLAGIPHEEIERGMTLASPGALATTERLDVRLTLLPSAPALKGRARLRLHLYTTEATAELRLYHDEGEPGEELRPGATVWAQLRTRAPIVAAPGDRFILRQLSPAITVGGGVVVDAAPLRRAKAAARIELLRGLASGSDAAVIGLRVARRERHGLRLPAARQESGWSSARLKAALAGCPPGAVTACGEWLIAGGMLKALGDSLHAEVAAFQKANPLAGGLSREQLLERSGLGREIFSAALDALLKSARLAATVDRIHLPGAQTQMKDEEQESKRRIEQAFATAGLKVPSLKETLAGLRIDLTRAQKLVTLLLREGALVKLGDELVFHRSALEELKKKVAAMKAAGPQIDVARFKDAFGLSRKYAIPLLEYLDRERITRRAGEARVIL